MAYFVEVILPLALDKTFTYQVSEAEFHYVKPGMRIAVPFGKSKIVTALALETHQNQPLLYEAKEIFQILDETPLVNEYQLKHWQWMAAYYMCSIGEVYRAAMPSAFLLESETVISLKQGELVDELALSDDEFLVFEALQHQSSIKVSDVISILNKIKPPYNVNELTQQRAIERLKDEYKIKQEIASIIEQREELLKVLADVAFVEKVYPTEANFVLVKVDDANKRYDQLIEKGIVIRNRTTQPLCENCLRFTIGIPEENAVLIKELKLLK